VVNLFHVFTYISEREFMANVPLVVNGIT